MRASANHTSEPVKRGGFGSTKAERSAFLPIVGICFVHFYAGGGGGGGGYAFSGLFDSYTSWTNHFEQLFYLLCFTVCILIGFFAIIIFLYLYRLSTATYAFHYCVIHYILFSRWRSDCLSVTG